MAEMGPGASRGGAGLAAAAAACAARCPGEASLEAELLEASGRLLVLAPGTRRGAAEEHVLRLGRLRAQGRLRVLGLGLAAVAYEAPFGGDAALYAATCRHLAPSWADLPGRLLDVGVAGRWWLLSARMRDWDVNPEEFRALPGRLRRVSFHDLHSARNERLFDQKYRPVVLRQEDVEREEGGRGAGPAPPDPQQRARAASQ
ncbi:mitochondrial import inner membrane translocase subunit Tim29 [Sphaerodactylus townsendi]|uniref:mitochondrial import inner membrane translocase subunit Tim29 n=1 Tax=Sphaerodactylus townsendi TaxID=933632 RepID=UPI002026BCFE|nr:mitochondrial import inner membrane translocase subunit Tim29 [Sphaerodactylus townsendi]